MKDSSVSGRRPRIGYRIMSIMQGRTQCGRDLVARSEFTHRRQFVHQQHEHRASRRRHHENHQGPYFSYGAIWEPDSPIPDNTVKLTNSEVTVESQHHGFQDFTIRANKIVLDHSIVNSQVNNVTNVK